MLVRNGGWQGSSPLPSIIPSRPAPRSPAPLALTTSPHPPSFSLRFFSLHPSPGSYDEDAVTAELEALIKKHPVIIFAWSFSPFSKNVRAGGGENGRVQRAPQTLHPPLTCPHLLLSPSSHSQARELLDNLGAKYHVVELDRVPQGFALKKELSKVRERGEEKRERTPTTPPASHLFSHAHTHTHTHTHQMTGRSSVPSIFVKGRHLGGCYDGPGIVPLYRTGELQKVLKAARALR